MRLRGPSSEGGGGVGGAPPAPPLPGSPRGSKGRRGPFTNEDLKMGGGRLSDSASPLRDAARRLRRAPCACLRQQRLIGRRAWGRGARRARLAGGRTNLRQAAPVCYADVLINPIGPALTRLPPGNRHLSLPRAHLVQPWVARPRHSGRSEPLSAPAAAETGERLSVRGHRSPSRALRACVRRAKRHCNGGDVRTGVCECASVCACMCAHMCVCECVSVRACVCL